MYEPTRSDRISRCRRILSWALNKLLHRGQTKVEKRIAEETEVSFPSHQSLSLSSSIYIYIYAVSISLVFYICIERERERERVISIFQHKCTAFLHTSCGVTCQRTVCNLHPSGHTPNRMQPSLQFPGLYMLWFSVLRGGSIARSNSYPNPVGYNSESKSNFINVCSLHQTGKGA